MRIAIVSTACLVLCCLCACDGRRPAASTSVPSAPSATCPAPQAGATVVLLADSTASMAPVLEAVKADMKRLIWGLDARTRLAVLTFDRQPWREWAPVSVPQLTYTGDNLAACSFVDSMKAQGRSKAPPAIERAFAILAQSPPPRELHLWTDADVASAQILQSVRQQNQTQATAAEKVRVHVILAVPAGGVADEQALAALRATAEETAGTLRLLGQ